MVGVDEHSFEMYTFLYIWCQTIKYTMFFVVLVLSGVGDLWSITSPF